jgi:hypothetical protein
MAKQTKPKSKRTKVRNLTATQQEMAATEYREVKGGNAEGQITLKGSVVKENLPSQDRRDPQLAFTFKVT